MLYKMNIVSYLSCAALLVLAVLAFISKPTQACSCMPEHPQTHFCRADYAVVVRVLRKSNRLVAGKVVYKVEIKKSYKMSDAGHEILKHGRIVTSGQESMCGVQLQVGKLYMIAARNTVLNLCSYIKEYLKMSLVERRGFAGAYRKACNCSVNPCFGDRCQVNAESSSGCKWAPFSTCETDFSACTPITYRTPEGLISKCHWRRTPAYKACLAEP